jgi:ankyrin repeat protein
MNITPLAINVWNLNLEGATKLINSGADVNEVINSELNYPPLVMLMTKNNENEAPDTIDKINTIIQLLLDNGAETNPGERTPLLNALRYKQPLKIIKLIANYTTLTENLQKNIANIIFQDFINPLKIIKHIYKLCPEFIDIRLQNNLNLMHLSAAHGSLNLLQFLYNKNENLLNAENDRKWTAVHYASYKGNFECVKFLVENNANISLATLQNEKPLYYASLDGHWKIVDYLIKTKVFEMYDLQNAHRAAYISYKRLSKISHLITADNLEKKHRIKEELISWIGMNEPEQQDLENKLRNGCKDQNELEKRMMEKGNAYIRCYYLLKNNMFENEIKIYNALKERSDKDSQISLWKKQFFPVFYLPGCNTPFEDFPRTNL